MENLNSLKCHPLLVMVILYICLPQNENVSLILTRMLSSIIILASKWNPRVLAKHSNEKQRR